MQRQEMEYLSPARKLVRFFESSRDKWKAKHHEVKKELKLAQNQVRAVEKSRAMWRQKAEDAVAELKCLQDELQMLKNVSP